MASVTPRHLLFGVVVFLFVMLAGFGIMNEMVSKDTSIVTDTQLVNYTQTFDKYAQFESKLTVFKNSSKNQGVNPGIFGFLDALVQNSWNVLGTLYDTVGFMNEILSGFASFVGVPEWVATLGFALISILIAFSIFSVIFRWDI